MVKKTPNTVKLLWDNQENSFRAPTQSFSEIERVFPNIVQDCNQISFFNSETLASPKPELLNRIIKGDNLQIMERLLREGYEKSIDLIYLDPPYFSEADYVSSIRLSGENQDPIERHAFKDTWQRGIDSYLDMLYPRLKTIKKLLSDNGSLFIHLDWHVSHYVRLLLDEIFTMDNLINEIIWCYGGGSGTKRHFHRKHDTIFWYVNGDNYTFNPQYRPYTHGTLERGLTRIKGDKYHLSNKGALMQDWWPDINKILSPTAAENLKFPTQKPAALLRRIINTASNPGDLVADFFAGAGTTASVCSELGRNWIIADNSDLAIQTAMYRMINMSSPFKLQAIKSSEENIPNHQLELLTPVVESYDNNTVLIKIGIKNYVPAVINSCDNSSFSRYIEFWAIDLDYQDAFHSDYQIMRENNRFKGNLDLSMVVRLPRRNKYTMAVKVYDVFAHNAMKIIEF